MTARLSPGARADAQRILDRAARRLLRERLDGDPVGALPTRGDNSTGDHRPDEIPLLAEGEVVPVIGRNGDGG